LTCSGLKNKRELWRVQYVLSNIRKAARDLLTLEANVGLISIVV
jgi:hypothetical protein